MMQMDDWQLLDDYANRNSEEAFRTLVDRYAGLVYHAALRPEETESVWAHLSPHLDDALDKLPTKEREAVLIRFFEARSHKEVALALGVSEDAAKMRLSRAIEKLRLTLAGRGFVVPTAVLLTAISTFAAHAPPAGVTASVATAALAQAEEHIARDSATVQLAGRGLLPTSCSTMASSPRIRMRMESFPCGRRRPTRPAPRGSRPTCEVTCRRASAVLWLAEPLLQRLKWRGLWLWTTRCLASRTEKEVVTKFPPESAQKRLCSGQAILRTARGSWRKNCGQPLVRRGDAAEPLGYGF